MSAPSVADGTMDSIHYDETACGPLCQHPQCWASNRRVERGLPRVAETPSGADDEFDDEGDLPSIKVLNLLDDYGQSDQDRYPSRYRGKDTKMPSHVRSASAPNIMAAYQRSPVGPPFTPFTSPLGIKGGSVRSTRSAKTPTRSRSRTTPKMSRVEVKEMLGSLGDLPHPSTESSSFYIWCPSKKMYKKQLHGKQEILQSLSKEPHKIQPKDLTDDMVPNMVEKKKQTKTQKNKRTVHETPTGGRPYTHPTRSPPPVARRTLPQDIDDGINQLLSLPRDVLMEVLDHIKKSDLLDKSKVQLLISRLMPLIHFAPDSPQPLQETSNTPLLDSGILQNHKITLHDMQQKSYDKHEFPQTSGNMPLFLDDAVVAQMASSVLFNEMQEDAENMENIPSSRREEMEIPMTRSMGRMAKAKPLGPIGASHREGEPLYKLASVSAKSLPPLKPGVRPVKPFNYTNNAATLDLTLVPLPPPKTTTPERTAPNTPYSAVASTLHVTVPSVPSPDRTVSTTPVMPYGRSPVPPLAKNTSARSSLTPLPSEEFRRRPMHAMSPSMSTKVPKTPLGTPATALRQQLLTRETLNPSKILTDHAEQSVESSSPTPHPPAKTATDLSEHPLGTKRATVPSTYPPDGSITCLNSRSDYVTSPSKQLLSSMSPYGFAASIAGQTIDEKDPVPITPAPTSATEDSWPNIDERDFMRSPDKGPDSLMTDHQPEHPAPAAPPPSPEPRDPNPDFEYQIPDGSKSAPLSLTPLAEEEELEEKEEDDTPKLPGDTIDCGTDDVPGVLKPLNEEEDVRNNETSADTGVMLESDEGNVGNRSESDRQHDKTQVIDQKQSVIYAEVEDNKNQSSNEEELRSKSGDDRGYVSQERHRDELTAKEESQQNLHVPVPSDDITSKKETGQNGDVITDDTDVTSSDVRQSGDITAQNGDATSKDEYEMGQEADDGVGDSAVKEESSNGVNDNSSDVNTPKNVTDYDNANSNALSNTGHSQFENEMGLRSDGANEQRISINSTERTKGLQDPDKEIT